MANKLIGLTDNVQTQLNAGVVGPASATDGHLAVFDTATGKLLKDGGALGGGTGDVVGPASATADHIVQFNSTTGKLVKDGGVLGTMAAEAAASYVAKALFDAYTILMATTDNTPAALAVTEQTLLGRITGGVIAALSIAQIQTLLGITAAGAALIDDADVATQLATLGALPLAGGAVTGTAYFRGSTYYAQPAIDTETTAAVTIHIADMLTGIVTGAPSAARAYTLDTGTNCDTGTTLANGDSFDWVLINLATTAAYIITLTAGVGHTIVGCPVVPAQSTTTGGLWGTSSAMWRTVQTAANTFKTYRIA